MPPRRRLVGVCPRRPGGAIGCSSMSDRRSWRSLYSSRSSRESSPRASAYVRRNDLTYVGPGSRSHSSFSSARRYFARILVSASSSEMSIRARIRASRSVAPISGMCSENLVVWFVRERDRLSHGRALAQRRDEPFPVALADQDLARLGPLVARDDAAALEHVDQAARPGVAEAQAPLQHRSRRGLHLGHQADRVLEQRVLVGGELVGRG